jgi:hypothetical protein
VSVFCVCVHIYMHTRLFLSRSAPVCPADLHHTCKSTFSFPAALHHMEHLHLTTAFVFTEFTELPQFRRNRMPPIRRLTFALLVRRPELDFDPCKYFAFTLPLFLQSFFFLTKTLLVRRPKSDFDPCKFVLRNKFSILFFKSTLYSDVYCKYSRALAFENVWQKNKIRYFLRLFAMLILLKYTK